MNKVININFQGRVIPIEEPAYEELKKYVESLRQYFANEEGKEEIINDIENRIAELFSEKLKNGQSAFISEAHVAAIIASMGRPEEFDGDTIEIGSTESKKQQSYSSYQQQEPRGTLYRDQRDKMLGGVCSGIANYLRIDTTIVRVLFAILAFGSFGVGLLIYVILWSILPSKFLSPTAISRKLYRDPDQRVIGGVCSGIAQYFNIAVWIPRLIFVLPLVVSFIEKSHFFFFPFIYSFSGTVVVAYLVLLAVIPKAKTASERMEMKGQKVDLESIKNKVQDEMQGVKKNIKENAGKWKQDFSEKASDLGTEAKEAAQRFAGEAGPAVRSTGNKFFHVIFTIVKVFLFIIAGSVAVALVAALIGVFTVGGALLPLKNFIVETPMLSWYFWGTIILFIAIPIIGLIQWLIRSIAGIKVNNNYIGMTLGILWTLGWVSVVMLAVTISKEFRRAGIDKKEISIAQPSTGKMLIQFKNAEGVYYPLDLNFDVDDHHEDQDMNGLLLSSKEDSMLLNNIRIKLVKSNDGQFHVSTIKRSRASSVVEAEKYASLINYPVEQTDTVLTIPTGFSINKQTKFRNQQVIIQVEIPVGKEIYVAGAANNFHWYNIKSGPTNVTFDFDNENDLEEYWNTGIWYVMTENGVKQKYEDAEQKDADSSPESDSKKDSSNHLKVKPTVAIQDQSIDENEELAKIAYSKTKLLGMGLGLLKMGF